MLRPVLVAALLAAGCRSRHGDAVPEVHGDVVPRASTTPAAPHPPSDFAPDPAARLIREADALAVRGGQGYWGLSPPADCTVVGATTELLRFTCRSDLSTLDRYFAYYYPTLTRSRTVTGMTIEGTASQATGHLTPLLSGAIRCQVILYRPREARHDPLTESVIQRFGPSGTVP